MVTSLNDTKDKNTVKSVCAEMEGAYYLSLMVGWFMVFNATFNNISGISWSGGNRRKPLTRRKSMTNLIT